MSEFRRRLMMAAAQGGGGGGMFGYVTNGLVLLLDGIEKGDVADVWTDLVDGHGFRNIGATFNTDHIYLSGSTSSYISNTSFNPPSSSSGTIEIVFDDKSANTSRLLFMPKGLGKIALGFTTSGIVLGTSSTRTYSKISKGSVSVSDSLGYGNGVALTAGSNDYWGSYSPTTSYIGKRSSGNPFKGNIYSIRIYDRQLTVDEILQNYAVDQSRFSLLFT